MKYSSPILSRREFLTLGGGTFAASVAGATLGFDSYRFTTTYPRKSLARLKAPVRVAHLSDLHFGVWLGENVVKSWIDATLAEAPDVVLITGDFVDRTTGDVAPLLRQLARLHAPLGVYGVLGNHDYDRGAAFLSEFKQGLERANVTLLVNDGVSLRDDLFLAGSDDLWKGRPDLAKTLANRPAEQACLLMAHNPDLLPILENIDLTLCGHTHGGQVKLPLVGAVMTGSKYGSRFLEGWIHEPVTAYVSRGLGMSGLPLRFASRAELAMLELTPV